VSEYIWTVEHGEYSDHTIDAFCTSEAEAILCAKYCWARELRDTGTTEDDWGEHAYSRPAIYKNATNVVAEWTARGREPEPERVYWHPKERRQ
jgi:hypothetical protein